MKRKEANLWINKLLMLTVLFLLFAGSIGLSTVWLRHKISETANATKLLEGQIQEARRLLNEANAKMAAAHNPEYLLRRNAELGLGLVRPREIQVVHVSEDVEIRLAVKRNQQMFGALTMDEGTPLASR